MPRHNITALGISTFLHLGLPALFFIVGSSAATPPVAKTVPISLSMFKPAPPPVVVEPVVVAKVEPPPKPEVKPKPKPKPKAKPKPKPKPKKKPKPEPVVEHEPVEYIEPIVQQPPVQVAKIAPAPVAAPAPTQPAFDPGKLALIEASYQSRLRQLIDEKKTYPRRAKRLGREGKVYVSFVVLPDGTIQEVTLREGSGVKILDQAAIKAILAVSGALPFPTEVKRHRWTFTVPISYELL